tara:strand:+ start:1660 stop:2853 length:1194 start_codon:yes stop_codon:yes gene_type:complete
MNNFPKLFICIGDYKITIIVVHINEKDNFEILKKIFLPLDGISENKITDIEKITILIKKNILFIEQKINHTFKDLILILDNLETSFLNLRGFKKLNGTQISKENITYILNSLKSCVDNIEKQKKIVHIFNSEFCLDRKKIDNLPIGLFGDVYSHELSFILLNQNDYKNLKLIFQKCNLKIKKILADSFLKGSYISNLHSKINTFYYIQIDTSNCKIIYVKNDSIIFEQKFKFGTEIVEKDISKIISIKLDIVKNIIENNSVIEKVQDNELIEKDYFINQHFRKIKKKTIVEIAKARIIELAEIIYLRNINFQETRKKVKAIFLEISDPKHLECFQNIYSSCFSHDKKFKVEIFHENKFEEVLKTANQIVDYGWKKEAIPVTKETGSYISRVFRSIFN